LGKVAGLGGIALGVAVLLLRDVFANHVFQSLPKDQAYQLLLIIVIGAFVLAALGIFAWSKGRQRLSSSASPKVQADNGGVAFGDGATSNRVVIDNSSGSRPGNVQQK
jgi:hypothetical protein